MTTSTTTAFAMPSLGADMDEGRIVEWLGAPGDHVDRGQIVVVVETDKSDIEVEVFHPATVLELLVHEGEMVAVGTPIAMFDEGPAHEPTASPRPGTTSGASGTSGRSEPAAGTAAPGPVTSAQPAGEPSHVTSPVIRHLADELHVDPNRVRGTGPGGLGRSIRRGRRPVHPRRRAGCRARPVERR